MASNASLFSENIIPFFKHSQVWKSVSCKAGGKSSTLNLAPFSSRGSTATAWCGAQPSRAEPSRANRPELQSLLWPAHRVWLSCPGRPCSMGKNKASKTMAGSREALPYTLLVENWPQTNKQPTLVIQISSQTCI